MISDFSSQNRLYPVLMETGKLYLSVKPGLDVTAYAACSPASVRGLAARADLPCKCTCTLYTNSTAYGLTFDRELSISTNE